MGCTLSTPQCPVITTERRILLCCWIKWIYNVSEDRYRYQIQHALAFPTSEDLSNYTTYKSHLCSAQLVVKSQEYLSRGRNKDWYGLPKPYRRSTNRTRDFICQIKDEDDTIYADTEDTRGKKRNYEKVLLERTVLCKCGGKQHELSRNGRGETIVATEQATSGPSSQQGIASTEISQACSSSPLNYGK